MIHCLLSEHAIWRSTPTAGIKHAAFVCCVFSSSINGVGNNNYCYREEKRILNENSQVYLKWLSLLFKVNVKERKGK